MFYDTLWVVLIRKVAASDVWFRKITLAAVWRMDSEKIPEAQEERGPVGRQL